jgi:hypothetical protein
MRAFFLILALSSLLVGCGSKRAALPSEATTENEQSNYEAALMDATNAIPCAADFLRLFPHAWTYFSYYTGVAGPSSFNMQTLLYGRYELYMKVPVTFGAHRRKVKTFGQPEFLLNAISNITNTDNGNLYISYDAGNNHRFGSSEWKRVVESGGEFSAIGYTVVTNSPLPRIQELQKYWDERMGRMP